MIEEKQLTEIGKFQKTHALKGELNAVLDTEPEFLTDGNAIVIDIDGIYVPFYCETIRNKGTFSYLIKLEGIDSESEAKPFVNKIIYALKEAVAEYNTDTQTDSDDIVFLDDLVGYYIIDNTLGLIGRITEVNDTTDNILFVVENSDGERIFIPAVEDLISSINEESKSVEMILPEGLLILNESGKNSKKAKE
ncbi:MAG: ribosome maturation factor RimM [Muribaculaceae bacterium]|nr:ribosome maturation factor RimM [Muribaculaceae bacterium]